MLAVQTKAAGSIIDRTVGGHFFTQMENIYANKNSFGVYKGH